MSEASARFGLPFLQSGQAQKELFHNEALALIDLALHPVAAAVAATPPTTQDPGQCWIVGGNPTGAWVGHDGELAGWTGGGWRFVAPREGMLVWVTASGVWARRSGASWSLGELPASSVVIEGMKVLGVRQPPIEMPAGGTVVDAEARIAISAVLEAIRAHGLIAV